jgi:hypothetical protein
MSANQTAAPHIDLGAVLANKLGRRARYVPKWLVRYLERVICAERLNALSDSNFGKRGAAFCRGVLSDLKVTVNVSGTENLPQKSHRKVMVVSNHPLGGLDGMALIDFFESYFGGDVYFVVNDMLMAIEPLTDVFVPVNKHGAQSREAAKTFEQVLASDNPVLIFPAGLVSRLGDDGTICDLEWKKMFVNKAVEHHRDIIPVFFSGENSRFFYRFARLRKRSGIKLNIEMVRLPRELFRYENGTLNIICGKTIGWQQLASGAKAAYTAAHIKQIVYSLNQK